MACHPGQPTVSQRLWFSFILKRHSWRRGVLRELPVYRRLPAAPLR